jgi:multimeric flavodoxin WrbA
VKLIIHDLPARDFNAPDIQHCADTHVLSNNGAIRNCIGCFGCWVKTPGKCVIADGYSNLGKLMSQCDDLIIISKCTYGGFSPFVKNVLDRTIPYISPHFVIRNKEMHHKRRYDNVIKISAYFYGADITEKEKDTAISLVTANAANYDGIVSGVYFHNSADKIKEVLA